MFLLHILTRRLRCPRFFFFFYIRVARTSVIIFSGENGVRRGGGGYIFAQLSYHHLGKMALRDNYHLIGGEWYYETQLSLDLRENGIMKHKYHLI